MTEQLLGHVPNYVCYGVLGIWMKAKGILSRYLITTAKWLVGWAQLSYLHADINSLALGRCCYNLNTQRPRQNGRHVADDILKCIFKNENISISIKISLKFVPNGPINNIPALVQIMAWRRPGDKQLSEPMIVSLLTHICVTRPQWGTCQNYNTWACLWGGAQVNATVPHWWLFSCGPGNSLAPSGHYWSQCWPKSMSL